MIKKPMTKQHLPWLVRIVSLTAVLAVAAVAIPDSTSKPVEVELVKVNQGDAVDAGNGIIRVLALGSDARPGESMLHSRGDTIQLISINTRTHAASIIGVPRDSWVEIPGHGVDKINSALYFGGPKVMGQTVGNLIGVQPQYVFVTRFNYFIHMVTRIHGLDLNNPYAFSDSSLKPKGFKAGHIHLSGYDAMAFSRIRHSLLRGDFDRSAHQQMVLKAIQAKVRARSAQPGFIERGVYDAMSHMSTNLRPSELFKLAQALAQVDPSKVHSCVVQGGIGTSSGGASIVLPFVSQARDMGNQVRKDATLSHCG